MVVVSVCSGGVCLLCLCPFVFNFVVVVVVCVCSQRNQNLVFEFLNFSQNTRNVNTRNPVSGRGLEFRYVFSE